MLPLNFNHLYYFWAVAKDGSISAARRRLFLTQSSLSMQVKSLEKSLKKRLLVRGRHGVTLTPAGRLAFEYAEKLFARSEEFVHAFGSDLPLPTPPVRLGVSGAVSRVITSKVLDFLQEAAPRNHARIFSAAAEDLRGRLMRGAVDLVISEMDLAAGMGPDYRSRHVARLPVYFVAAPAVAAQVRRFPADLSLPPLLMRAPDNPLRKEVDHFLYSHRIPAVLGAETEDIDFIRTLLLDGRGAAAIDALTVRQDLASRKLVKLHPRPVGLWQNIWFLYRRHHKAEPALQQVLDVLMDSFVLPS
jgi:LysR family transcriptional regulator, transcriptional activator of nhaA